MEPGGEPRTEFNHISISRVFSLFFLPGLLSWPTKTFELDVHARARRHRAETVVRRTGRRHRFISMNYPRPVGNLMRVRFSVTNRRKSLDDDDVDADILLTEPAASRFIERESRFSPSPLGVQPRSFFSSFQAGINRSASILSAHPEKQNRHVAATSRKKLDHLAVHSSVTRFRRM